MQAFWRGFGEVFGIAETQALLGSGDCDTRLSGLPGALDVHDWAQHTELQSGPGQRDQRQDVARCFWEAVNELSGAQQKRLLFLSTEYVTVPAEGFGMLDPGFKLMITGREDQLPAAHTCFNRLDIPCIAQKSVMLTKLTKFLEYLSTERASAFHME